MENILNLIGMRFGRLVVVDKVDNDEHGHNRYLCKCDCGNEKIIRGSSLKNGNTKSCGCYQKEISSSRKPSGAIHYMSNTKLYSVWSNMKYRCYDIKNREYKRYGMRGIIICNEWKNDFISFYNWAINNGYQDNLTIDRKDNDGNYEPNNCRWITNQEQCNNKRNNRLITINGQTKNLAEWSKISGINRDTLIGRINRNWNDPLIKVK
jgi:hypothetical protein